MASIARTTIPYIGHKIFAKVSDFQVFTRKSIPRDEKKKYRYDSFHPHIVSDGESSRPERPVHRRQGSLHGRSPRGTSCYRSNPGRFSSIATKRAIMGI